MLHKNNKSTLKKSVLAVLIADLFLLTSCGKEAPQRIHYDNPFAEAKQWYVNPVWSENAKADGGETIANVNTALWLTSVSDLQRGGTLEPKDNMTLPEHLDEALAQSADLIVLTLFNLPDRGCTSPLGEAGVIPYYPDFFADADGIDGYKRDYVDKIVSILSDDKYAGISIVAIVEPDSLIHLPSDESGECESMANDKSWGYTEGVRYALTQFATLPNIHSYLDAANSATLGWNEALESTAMFMAGVLTGYESLDGQALEDRLNNAYGTSGQYENLSDRLVESIGITPPPGWDSINGFVTNLANYGPLEEPYIRVLQPEANAGEYGLFTDSFYDWNPTLGEHEYSEAWLEALREYGGDESLGIIIDTSRNGWGGHTRPSPDPIPTLTANPSADEIKAAVDALRIDRRPHRRSFCNQDGAGIGERPQASPKPHIDAYIWGKPVGESDGASSADFEVDPNMLNRKHEEMCDPNGQNRYAEASDSTTDAGIATGAMDNAPHFGRWFSEGFKELLENAHPPLN